jgi:hypothetical protein
LILAFAPHGLLYLSPVTLSRMISAKFFEPI